jgi:cytochrome oxidase assembly protein ShyY1
MPLKFRFRWIPFVAALVVAAIGISLGQWQTRRAQEKEAIEAKMTARETATPTSMGAEPVNLDELEYRRVLVRGEFVRDWPLYLDNRPYQGKAGLYVLMPFKIAGSHMHVLVARGWIARNPVDRTRLPPIETPAGTVELEAFVQRGTGHVLQLGSAEPLRPGAIVQNVEVADVAQAAKLSMQLCILEQSSDTQDRLVRDWPRPSAGVEKHRGYAFQWYALAATAILFFVVTGFRRGRN